MTTFSASIVTLLVSAAVGFAQNPTRTRELHLTDGKHTMKIVPPSGLERDVVFDLSGLSKCIDPSNPTAVQQAAFTAAVVDGKIVFGVQKGGNVNTADAPSTLTIGNTANDHVMATRPSTYCESLVTIPMMKEFESFTAHVECAFAIPGSAVSASPRAHLPEGFLVAYATCITPGIVDIKLINVAGICTQPLSVEFAVGIVQRN